MGLILTTGKQRRSPLRLKPEQYAALDELSKRFSFKSENVDFGTREGLIRSSWILYIQLLNIQGRARNALPSRRTATKTLARLTGHKLTIEDARKFFSELDDILVKLFTEDLEEMQRPGATPKKRRRMYRARPKPFKLPL